MKTGRHDAEILYTAHHPSRSKDMEIAGRNWFNNLFVCLFVYLFMTVRRFLRNSRLLVKNFKVFPHRILWKSPQTCWSLMRRQGRTLSAHTASFPDDEDRNGSKTSAFSPFNHLTRLLVGEYFIEFSRRESCNIYILSLRTKLLRTLQVARNIWKRVLERRICYLKLSLYTCWDEEIHIGLNVKLQL
jgi:hypothetical protein